MNLALVLAHRTRIQHHKRRTFATDVPDHENLQSVRWVNVYDAQAFQYNVEPGQRMNVYPQVLIWSLLALLELQAHRYALNGDNHTRICRVPSCQFDL